MPKNSKIEEVKNLPAKDFFVSMLTRDIDLPDAILDLLDNCVDGARRDRTPAKTKADSLKGFWAKITYSPDKFCIEDNCGGISWELASKSAFYMGRPPGIAPEPGSIGVVGIGMKRAIFKMGRECHVHSHHKDDTFLITIPPKWFEDNSSWEPFDAKREAPRGDGYGTIIEVTQLEDTAKLAFAEGSSFSSTFPDAVAEAYTYLIEKGFEVFINTKPIKASPLKLFFEKKEHPRSKAGLIRPYVFELEKEGVSVFLTVGYRAGLKTEAELAAEAERTFSAKEAGWTIICNDRVVLSNDRSVKTGWGVSGVPSFHNQFSSIAGVVEFRSEDVSKLPITTTKRGVDAGNELFISVRHRMQEGLKVFTRNTNRWKGHEQELKKRFNDQDLVGLNDIKKVAKSVTFANTTGGKQYKPELPEKKVLKTDNTISFSRPIKQIERVSLYLFDEEREASEVGEACFDRILTEATK